MCHMTLKYILAQSTHFSMIQAEVIMKSAAQDSWERVLAFFGERSRGKS